MRSAILSAILVVGCAATPTPQAPGAPTPEAPRRVVHIPAGTYNDDELEELDPQKTGTTETLRAAAPAEAAACAVNVDGTASQALAPSTIPPGHTCRPRTSNGYPVPDPTCTPGAYNPTVSVAILKAPGFKTSCVRDKATTSVQKAQTYDWYAVTKPSDNRGQNQVCELDHLVSLELGGADTLDNIWPQCGPDGVTLNDRFFKIKDAVENYLAREVKAGRMSQREAQRGIASDWTQYIDAAAP